MRRWIVAVLLAGCGADGPTYDPAPADAVASCSIVQTVDDFAYGL